MKRQNVSPSNGGLNHPSDTAGFDTIEFRNVSQERWMATSVPQATADRRTTTDAVRWEGEGLRSVRPMPAGAGGLAPQCFGPSCVSRVARKGYGSVILRPNPPSLARR